MDLTCCPGWKVGMLGSMVFVGWFVTLPWLPRISDMYSRKWVFTAGMIIDWFLFIVMFFTTRIEWMIVVTFVFGLATTIRVNVGFVYMMELMPKRNQSFYASTYNTFEGAILLLATLYFWFVSRHWIYFTLIGFGLSTWNVIAIQFVPESPRLLIELQRLNEAKVCLERIAKWNKVPITIDIEIFRKKVREEGESKTGLPLKFWMKQRPIVINLLSMAVIWLCCSFNFYLIQFLLTSFDQVYLSTIFSCISDMTAYATGGLIFKYLGVKKTQILGCSIALLGGAMILSFGL